MEQSEARVHLATVALVSFIIAFIAARTLLLSFRGTSWREEEFISTISGLE
jgi:hypothetical protein